MKRSGLKMVFCGAESGSTDMLKRMNKGGTASAELTLELARADEVATASSRSSRSWSATRRIPKPICAQTLSFIRRIKPINDATEIILYVYSPVPMDGTFYDAAQQQGFAFPDTLDEMGRASAGRRSRCAAIRARRGRTAKSARRCATSRAC